MDKRTNGQIDGQNDKRKSPCVLQDFFPFRAAAQKDRWTDRWMDGRTDSPCVLQDFVPFGAAALLPHTAIPNQAKQGNGYR